jgi:hypothetical protein
METLHAIFDQIDKGVLVMMTSDQGYFDYLMIGRNSLTSRINKRIVLQPLSGQEACLMIARRMLPRRVVEDMQALYPFNDKAVIAMNQHVNGNPRELLKLADRVIEEASLKRIIQVDEEFVDSVLGASPDFPAKEECKPYTEVAKS